MSWGGRRVMRLRAAYQPIVDAGAAVCVRCGLTILAGESWDLDHTRRLMDGGAEWDVRNVRPAHASCNRRDGALAAAARRGRRTVERLVRPGFF